MRKRDLIVDNWYWWNGKTNYQCEVTARKVILRVFQRLQIFVCVMMKKMLKKKKLEALLFIGIPLILISSHWRRRKLKTTSKP